MSFRPTGSSSQPAQGEGQPNRRMVPVRPPTGRPLVTYTIVAVTVIVYILQELNRAGILQTPFLALTGLVFGPQNLPAILSNGWGNDLLVLLGGKISALIFEGQYWRLLTPALLHGSLQHIGANMITLVFVGQRIERFYGHGRFLGLYILSAIGGNLLSFLLTPGISLGASTAVFGLIIAEGVFAFQNRELFGPQARAMLNSIVYLVIINLVVGLSERTVDNWGHLGGLLVGLAFSWFAGPLLEVSGREPDYVLVDKRVPATIWLVGILIFVFLAGVTIAYVQLQ